VLFPSKLADFLHLVIGAFLQAGFYHYCCPDPGGRAAQPGLPSCWDAGLCLLEHQVPLPPPRHHSQEYSGTTGQDTQVPQGNKVLSQEYPGTIGQDTQVLQGYQVLSQEYSGTTGQDTQVLQGNKVLSQKYWGTKGQDTQVLHCYQVLSQEYSGTLGQDTLVL
jgi:hypothetical protein